MVAKSKTRKSLPHTTKAPAAGPSTQPDVPALIERAHILLAQSNHELAAQFLTRALYVDPANLEARELLGIAHLEAGDPAEGRHHLLQLFPPHTADPPASPSPYLYLAQSAEDPHEALGYYSTSAAMIEKQLKAGAAGEEGEMVDMAVRALVAMIEIWMSDLCFDDAAETNCDSLVARALAISPKDPEVRLALASIRMSQQRTEEAKRAVTELYEEIKDKEPFDESLPALPARLNLSRQLLEHSLHLPALDVIQTIREEDSLNVEGAYLEGWALYLRAEALEATPAIPPTLNRDEEAEEVPSADECYAESMRSLMECAKLFSEQDYPDEGIGAHVAELLESLEKKGVKPAEPEEEDDAGEEGEEAWEDVVEDGDVTMS